MSQVRSGHRDGTVGRPVSLLGSDGSRGVRQGIQVVPHLRVACWCEAQLVRVATSEVRAGRTGSCGAEGCGP